MRLLLGAFGDPGHAFPAIALGRELAARGHDVHLQTWERWREHVEAEGMTFAVAPEYHVFPTENRPLKPYQAVVRAARAMAPYIEDLAPDAVIADILTLGPALAGEMAGAPVGTLVPHLWPVMEPDWPPWSIGARLPRTRGGRELWRRTTQRLVAKGLEQGRGELNETRRRLGLPPIDHVHNGLSDQLALVATFPQLEYPRAWPEHVHVVGPLLWELPNSEVAEPPPGDAPLVLVAPSTVHDPEHRLLRATLEGLADEPVRVLASWNRRPAPEGITIDVPANARLVEWISYVRAMPLADVVVAHVGHGTLARALQNGCTVVACPGPGDQAESAARLVWAGLGVRVPPRFVGPRAIRLAVRSALSDQGMRARVREIAAWSAAHDGPSRAADVVETFAARERASAAVSP